MKYPLLTVLTAIGLLTGWQRAAAAEATPNTDAQRLMRLGPGDSVSIEVYGQPDMTTTVYVGDDGTINVPLAGPVQVNKLSPVEAAAKTERALKAGGFFVEPHVNINLVQSRSQRVSVLGEVRTPGRYPIEPNTTIFELLAQVGGETENGADVGFISRKDGQGHSTRIPVDLKDLGAKNGPRQTVTLQGGDELFVPKVEKFYIYGEVASPNMYPLEPGMNVLQAIARAGGITTRGSERRVEIKRLGKDGQTVTMRAKPSDSVQPNDVVRIKESIF